MGVGGQQHAPATLPQERPHMHCIGGWVAQGQFGWLRKISLSLGFDPTTQPIANCCTN
jgi:hypothetical protein